jgi:hypothetical protein
MIKSLFRVLRSLMGSSVFPSIISVIRWICVLGTVEAAEVGFDPSRFKVNCLVVIRSFGDNGHCPLS